jgi:hypothetical protein
MQSSPSSSSSSSHGPITMEDFCKSAKRPKSGARECLFRAQIARSESRKLSEGVTNETDLSTSEKEEDLLLDAVRLSIFPVNGHSTLNDTVGSNGVSHDVQCGRTMGHAETEVLDVLSSIPNSLVTHDFSSDSQGDDSAVDPCVDWGQIDQHEHPTATLDRTLEQDRALIDFGSSFVAHARLAMLYYTRNMDKKDIQTKVFESDKSGIIPSCICIDSNHNDSCECDKSRIHEDRASSSSCSHGSRCRKLDMQKAEAAACTAMNIYRLVFGTATEMQSEGRIERVMSANGAAKVTSDQSRERQDAEKAVAATYLEEKETLCGAVGSTSNLIALSNLWKSSLFFGPLGRDVRGGAVGAGCSTAKDDRSSCNRSNDSGMDYLKNGKLSYSKLKMLEVRSRMADSGMVHSTSTSISAATGHEGRTVAHPREGANSQKQLFDNMGIDGCAVSIAETEHHDGSIDSPAHHDSSCSRAVAGHNSASTSTACEEDQRVGILRNISIAADEVKGMEAAKGLSDSSSSSSTRPHSNNAINQVEWRRREWEKEDKGCLVIPRKGHIEAGRPQGGVCVPVPVSVPDVAALPTRIGNKKDRRNALRRERFGPASGPGLEPTLPPDLPP